MKPAYKHCVAAAALALLGLSAGAQTPPPGAVGPGPGSMMQGQQRPMMQEHMARMQQRAAQRQARLKQILQLTPAQEGAWNAWVASRQPATLQRPDPAEFARLTTPERIDRMRALRATRAAEMDRRGEATKTFYAALAPAQQKAFDALQLERRSRPGGGHRGFGHHRG